MADGDVVASRGGNRLTKSFGLGYPDFDRVLASLDERQAAGGPK